MPEDTGEDVPDMYEVTWKGKTQHVTAKDYESVRDGVFGRLKPPVDTLNQCFSMNRKVVQGATTRRSSRKAT